MSHVVIREAMAARLIAERCWLAGKTNRDDTQGEQVSSLAPYDYLSAKRLVAYPYMHEIYAQRFHVA